MQYLPPTPEADSARLAASPLAETAPDSITRLPGAASIVPSQSSVHAVDVDPPTRIPARFVVASEFEPRNLNSALRGVYFAHPRQNHIAESVAAIQEASLTDEVKDAMSRLVAGPLRLGRQDSKAMAKQRSPRLTCGQIAADVIAHIDNLLATELTLRHEEGDAGSHAIAARESVLSAPEMAELQRYKRVLLFFQKTTSFDTVLSENGIRRCLDENGFCAVHDNDYGKDAHSMAVLFVNQPPQFMLLNDLTSEIRPVAQSLGLVGGDKLQWNKLYVVSKAKDAGFVYRHAADHYNKRAPMLNTDLLSYCHLAKESELLPLYRHQFTRPIIGYGCGFKTIDDMEGVILSSDLRSKLQRHLQTLALLALKTRNLAPGQAIPEEKIWSVSDAPRKNR
jgi:hypothetical protein